MSPVGYCSDEELLYEQPLQTAMLLSLAGVSSLWTNQWYASVENSVDRTNSMIRGISKQEYCNNEGILAVCRVVVGE